MPGSALGGSGPKRPSPKRRTKHRKASVLNYPPAHHRNSLFSHVSDPRCNQGFTGAKKETDPSATVKADDVTFVLLFRENACPQFGWIYDGHPLKNTVRENDTLATINGESAKGFSLHDFFRKLPQSDDILVAVTTKTKRGPQTVEILFGEHRTKYEEEQLKQLNPLQIHRLQSGTFTLPTPTARQFVRHNRTLSRRDFVFQSRLGSPSSTAFNILTPRGNMRKQNTLEAINETPPEMREISDDTGPDNTSSSASFGGSDRGSRDFLNGCLDAAGSWDFDNEFANWKAGEASKSKMEMLLGLPDLSGDRDSPVSVTLPQPSATSHFETASHTSLSDNDSDSRPGSPPPRMPPRVPRLPRQPLPAATRGRYHTPFEMDARRYPTFDRALRALIMNERRKKDPLSQRGGASEKQPLPNRKKRIPMAKSVPGPKQHEDRPKIDSRLMKIGPRTKSKAFAKGSKSEPSLRKAGKLADYSSAPASLSYKDRPSRASRGTE